MGWRAEEWELVRNRVQELIGPNCRYGGGGKEWIVGGLETYGRVPPLAEQQQSATKNGSISRIPLSNVQQRKHAGCRIRTSSENGVPLGMAAACYGGGRYGGEKGSWRK